MTVTTTEPDPDVRGAANPAAMTLPVIAGIASLGAGAIHAAAIGAHNDHRSVVVAFALLAAFQLAWGAAAVALRPPRRAVLLVGAVGNGAAVIGWLLAKTRGIGFISGLEDAEAVQLADAAAAALAFAAAALVLGDLLLPVLRAVPVRRSVLAAAALPIAAVTLASMVSAGSHAHSGGHEHGTEVATSHEHGDDPAGEHSHDDDAGANPGPFDPADGVDLSGVPGVSAEEQAEAEDLVEATLDRLPQFADLTTLNAKGYYSIGDGITGDEHYVNWSYVNDDKILDPDYPESLVVRHQNGTQRLVAAMFMLPDGTTLDEVPDLGGDLVQWHVHGDLCFTDDPIKPTLAFGELAVGVDQECTPPNSKRGNVPMVHVWIVPHPCGPFAALEGIGGGQVAVGAEVTCNEQHAHVSEDAATATLPGTPETGGAQLPDLANITPEQMAFGRCVTEHGGNIQELIAATTGADPSPELRSIIDQCGGIPPGSAPSGVADGPAPADG